MATRNKNKIMPHLLKSTVSAVILTALVLVIVLVVQKLSEVSLPKFPVSDSSPTSEVQGDAATPDVPSGILFSVALMADSEGDFTSLREALEIAKTRGVRAVFFLGDFTSWGDLGGLKKSKELLDASGLSYFVLPGDHDLAQSVQSGDPSGLSNFTEVFGEIAPQVSYDNTHFVLLNNSANYTPVPQEILDQFENKISPRTFVILSQPLYHPTNSRVMGVIDGEKIHDVREQALDILEMVRASGAQAVVAADQHYFSRSWDPVRDSLEHIVVGALVSNEKELRNPQSSRFALLHILEDGGYQVEELVL